MNNIFEHLPKFEFITNINFFKKDEYGMYDIEIGFVCPDCNERGNIKFTSNHIPDRITSGCKSCKSEINFVCRKYE